MHQGLKSGRGFLTALLLIGLSLSGMAAGKSQEFCPDVALPSKGAGAPSTGSGGMTPFNPESDWQEFFSTKAGFRARFPAIPARAKENLTLAKPTPKLLLDTWQTYDYMKAKHQAIGYTVGLARLGQAKAKHPDLKKALQALTANYGDDAEIKFSKTGKFRGFPALEFLIQTKADGMTFTVDGVLFLDKAQGRLFQVSCQYSPPKERLIADCDYFFQNFRVQNPVFPTP